MKKLLCIIVSSFAFMAFSFAQTGEASAVSEMPETSSAEATTSASSDFKRFGLGFFGNYDQALGDLADYVSASTGGGLTFEAALLKNLGIAVHAGYGFNPVKDDCLDSMWNLRFLAGVYARIPFGTSGFAFQPEADIGCALNFPEASSDQDKKLDSCYVDQIYQLALSFRYSNPKMLNGRMEFELAPTYTISPENNSSVHYAGGRAGVLFKF